MKRNKETLGAQYRQHPPVNYLRRVDVSTGKMVTLTAKCKCCGEDKLHTEYYWFRKTKKNIQNAYDWVRKPICVECWNEDTNIRSSEKRYKTKEYKELKELQRIIDYIKEMLTRENNLERFFG